MISPMTVPQLEAAVSSLKPDELAKFHQWYEEYIADAWDERIERDIKAGRLDHLVAEADREFEAGRCTPL
jgi:hypothetical protein